MITPHCSFWLAPLLCLFVSCSNHYVVGVLARAEQMMESGAPDSALISLNALHPEEIRESHLRARLSLDRAMALDKCYVDTADISILAPAINYYRGPFHRREQYLTAYYQGRILENGNRDEEALKAFMQAGLAAKRSKDSLYMVRISAAKARIYLRNLSFRQAEDATDEGLRWCTPNSPNWSVLMLDKVEHLLMRKHYGQAYSMLSSLPPTSLRWLEASIRLCRAYPPAREEYKTIIDGHKQQLHLIRPVVQAEYLFLEGQPSQALTILEKDTPRSLSEQTIYYLIRRDAERAVGKVEEAYRSFLAYSFALESWFAQVSDQDIRYVEEKHQQWIREQRHRQGKMLYLLFLLITISVLAYWRIRYRTKRKEWKSKMDELRAEYESLLRWRCQMEEKNRQIGAVLDIRIRALAPFFSQELPVVLDRSPELDRLLTERKDILSNIGLLFALYHPAFVQELEGFGLDYMEVGFCCLYALGLRVNEIPEVLGRDAYHVNPHIRKKIGLDVHDTNLPNWVRDLYAQKG